jgi:hypothetical protein
MEEPGMERRAFLQCPSLCGVGLLDGVAVSLKPSLARNFLESTSQSPQSLHQRCGSRVMAELPGMRNATGRADGVAQMRELQE